MVKTVAVLRLTAADDVTATETGVEDVSTAEDVLITALETTARVELDIAAGVELETCPKVVVVFPTWETEVVVALEEARVVATEVALATDVVVVE